MSEIKVRVTEEPVGGARIAWSYLATVVALLVGGLFWAIWSPLGGLACADPEDLACNLGWGFTGAIIGPTLGLALGAFVFRLGWEWWAILAGLLLGMPVWFDMVPDAVRIVVLVLGPALAAAATWTGPRRPAWRPWVIGGAAAALVVTGLLLIVL